MTLKRAYRFLGSLAALTLLVSCASPYALPSDVAPATVTAPSAQSQALADYYADLQREMRLRGLLLQDDQNANVALTPRILARNFEAIAMFDEYRPVPTGFVHQTVPSQLRRWDQPVRMSVEFGASVPQTTRQSDNRFIADYAQRLSQVSGHPITLTSQRPNYLVLVVGEDDKRATAQRIRNFVPNISETTILTLEAMPRTRLCLVYAFPSVGNPMAYGKAIAIIRAEQPTLLRRSCIHEEVAQGLGLANDSPQARPSIFNDDEEFGFLTRHDELLLKILYDPRLKVGMTADQARPVVTIIANELAG